MTKLHGSVLHDSLLHDIPVDPHTAELREARRAVRRERDRQVAALYPHARTFVLKNSDPIGGGRAGLRAAERVPHTLTLITPDHADVSRDQLFVGQFPVLSRDMHWDAAFEELTFATSDGTHAIRGTLRITHSRLKAYGVISIGGDSVSVEYEVKPQRYRMKVAKDAAYLAGQLGTITWDTNDARWKNAAWSKDYEVGFTYGVNGEEIIGGEKVYTFVASFDDIRTGRKWEPIPFTYGGLLNREQVLVFALSAGVKTPSGPGAELFPYQLRVKLSEFGYDFAGGIVVGQPGYQGTVYGVIGDWAGAHIAGLYHVDHQGAVRTFSVVDHTLYAGTVAAANTVVDGDRLTWSGVPKDAARAAGIPSDGWAVFSQDGSRVVASSFGAVGERVHADEVLQVVGELGAQDLATVLRNSLNATGDPGHELSDLIRMSQFTTDEQGRFYDVAQEKSMRDFYAILQNYMDPGLRQTFFDPNPPALDLALRTIAQTKGTKGTEPIPWYGSLSVPYTAVSVGKYSTDPYAATLNTIRAESWLSMTTSSSDVMSAQGPLLYQRRYQEKHDNLDWFLVDQKTNAAKYDVDIDAKAAEWLKTARETAIGTPEELAELDKQIHALADAAKKNKQFWAFAIYTHATSPAYINMLQTLLATGAEVDGSEFSQRVQRTVALLNVLDTTSFFSQQYAYLLQLFELSSILPQMADLTGDLKDFSFAVKQILDKFVETYIDSADPAMRDAAEKLREHASEELVSRILGIVRTAAATGYGLFNWGFFAAKFESLCAKLFTGLPAIITRLTALAAMSALLMFFMIGSADWATLPEATKGFVILGAVNVIGLTILPIIKRGFALAEVWSPQVGLRTNLRMFFSPKLMSDAQKSATTGFRNWLLQEAGPKIPTGTLTFRQWWGARKMAATEATGLIGESARSRYLRAIFGRNLTQFMARALAGAFAITGIVMSAIELSKGGEPLEQAANAMFLVASVLELVAAVGGWALGGSALAVGGLLVSTIFSVVAVVGFIALAIGAILLIILMTRPKPSPVEQFAKDRAGDLYMQYKAAIESFRLYQPLGQPQRAGIAITAGGDSAKALTIGSDGSVKQGALDHSGHTAFYLETDQLGRVHIGAPILDAKGAPVLQTLATDDAGAVTSKNSTGDNTPTEPKLLWYADIQGEGHYEDVAGVKELKYAPFKLRSAYWADKGESRYLSVNAQGGWHLTSGDGTVVRLELVATKPAELVMNNVVWYSVAHDEETMPALQVPGSFPRQWSVSPALPEGVQLDPEDGTVSMRKGFDVPPAPRKSYRLTVDNKVGTVHTSFDLEVRELEDEALAA